MKIFPYFAALTTSATLCPALDFLTVTDVATPNMIEGNPGGNPLTNIIEGAGLGYDINEPHTRLGGTWYTDAPGGFPSDYIVSNPGDEIIILDLGEDRTLYELSYWGYADTNGNGLRDFEVRFATDAEGGAAGLGDESFGSSITDTFLFNALNDQTPRQSFGFGKAITARYVEVKALTNYFNIVVGGDRLGIGEISFAQPTAIGAPDIVPTAPQVLDFDSGSSFQIPVLNTGDSDLNISNISFTGPNADAFSVVNTIPLAIGPFLNGPIEIQFDKTGLGGEVAATMVVTSDDPDEGTIEIPLSGTLPPLGPIIVVTSPATITLNETGVQSFELPISNNGGLPLTISGVSVTGSDADLITVTSFPASLGVDSQGEIVIEIDPQLAGPGAIDAAIEIASNDSTEPNTTITLITGLPVVFHPIANVQTNTVDFYAAPNLISGIGIGFESPFPHTSIGAGQAATWVTDAPNGGSGDYFANAQPNPVIIFDLGANVPLGEINTWGYSNTNSNGAKDYTLRFATDAEGGAEGLGDEEFGSSITFQPSFEAAFSANDRDVEVFEEPVLARYVEMTITDNWQTFNPAPGGDRVGLGEVAFPVFDGNLNPALGIVSSVIDENGNFAVTFYSNSGVEYQLDRSTDGLNWERLPVSINGSPDDTTTIIDDAPLADAKVVLYRVVQP